MMMMMINVSPNSRHDLCMLTCMHGDLAMVCNAKCHYTVMNHKCKYTPTNQINCITYRPMRYIIPVHSLKVLSTKMSKVIKGAQAIYKRCVKQDVGASCHTFWDICVCRLNCLDRLWSQNRTANSIFGKIGRSASEETTLQLILSKCIPALVYGLEACPTNKSDLRSLDFVLGRFFMKLFRTSNVAIVRQCQELFVFQLPSVTLCKRVDKFVCKYYAPDNLLCKICSKFV